MTTITLDIPDDLAVQLIPLQDQLPELLSLAVDLFTIKPARSGASEDSVHPVFTEMIDFLVSRPTPEQIVGFKFSSEIQTRLEMLLEKNRESSLTETENAELDTFEQVNHLLILLKAQARSILTSTN
jgi:hypothetical protein